MEHRCGWDKIHKSYKNSARTFTNLKLAGGLSYTMVCGCVFNGMCVFLCFFFDCILIIFLVKTTHLSRCVPSFRTGHKLSWFRSDTDLSQSSLGSYQSGLNNNTDSYQRVNNHNHHHTSTCISHTYS